MSIFDKFRNPDGPPVAPGPLGVDDLMGMEGGSEGENPVLQSPSELPPPDPMAFEANQFPGRELSPMQAEGPESSLTSETGQEMRDFLLERAKARDTRSLQYQQQAREANGLK